MIKASRVEIAHERIVEARARLVCKHAGDEGEPGTRPTDQLCRYVFAPHVGVEETKLDAENLVIYYNPEWVLKINREILETGLYSMMPDTGFHNAGGRS